MPHYRVHRIKEGPREQFRWAAHVGGLAVVKAKDYEMGEELEAATAYAAWKHLGETGKPLRPGDLLEVIHDDGAFEGLRSATDSRPAPKSAEVPLSTVGAGSRPALASGELRIAKYIGFEPAQWFVPETKTDSVAPSAYTAVPESADAINPVQGTRPA